MPLPFVLDGTAAHQVRFFVVIHHYVLLLYMYRTLRVKNQC